MARAPYLELSKKWLCRFFEFFCAATRHPLTPHPQGVRRIRKAAKPPTAAQREVFSPTYTPPEKMVSLSFSLREKLGETFEGNLM